MTRLKFSWLKEDNHITLSETPFSLLTSKLPWPRARAFWFSLNIPLWSPRKTIYNRVPQIKHQQCVTCWLLMYKESVMCQQMVWKSSPVLRSSASGTPNLHASPIINQRSTTAIILSTWNSISQKLVQEYQRMINMFLYTVALSLLNLVNISCSFRRCTGSIKLKRDPSNWRNHWACWDLLLYQRRTGWTSAQGNTTHVSGLTMRVGTQILSGIGMEIQRNVVCATCCAWAGVPDIQGTGPLSNACASFLVRTSPVHKVVLDVEVAGFFCEDYRCNV